VSREALADGQDVQLLARSVAYDFTIFDGMACLCPQVCFVEEGGAVSPAELARLVAEQMARLAAELPPRRLDLADASRKHGFRQLCLMSSAMDVVAAPEDCSFLVAVEAMERLEPSCGERFVRIAPVAGPADLDRLIGSLPRRHLQCAALAIGDAAERHHELRELLAVRGVTRIVPPGIMGRPSMMWHHDGVACLGRMVAWCDHEVLAPELLLERDVDQVLAEIERQPSKTMGAALVERDPT
jgi:Acyl-CoA reductase (LuxC)